MAWKGQQSCKFDNCPRDGRIRGWCNAHYLQWKRGQTMKPLTKPDYRRGKTCSFEGCGRGHVAKGYCDTHLAQLRRTGRLQPIKVKKHRLIDDHGYVRVYKPDHPNRQCRGWIFEHVFVMSETLGRPLIKGENVHHKNGDKQDNRPGNLELWLKKQPYGQRVSDQVAWAKELLARYEPEALA